MMRNRPGRGATAGLLYTEGDPGLGIPPTVVGDKEMNNIQEELCNFIEYKGITLDGDDTTQLIQAIEQTIIDLGLGEAAFLDVGQVAGTVAAGDDNRFHSNANDPTANQKAAMDNASGPTGINPFATIADIPGAVGENNTASNQGGGVGLFKAKSGVDLQFKTLVPGANVAITPAGADEVIISSTGGGGGGVAGLDFEVGVVSSDSGHVPGGNEFSIPVSSNALASVSLNGGGTTNYTPNVDENMFTCELDFTASTGALNAALSEIDGVNVIELDTASIVLTSSYQTVLSIYQQNLQARYDAGFLYVRLVYVTGQHIQCAYRATIGESVPSGVSLIDTRTTTGTWTLTGLTPYVPVIIEQDIPNEDNVTRFRATTDSGTTRAANSIIEFGVDDSGNFIQSQVTIIPTGDTVTLSVSSIAAIYPVRAYQADSTGTTNSAVSLRSTRTTTGTWTITGLTPDKPIYLVMEYTTNGDNQDFVYNVISGSEHDDVQPYSNQAYLLGRTSTDISSNVGIVIPSSTTVSINVIVVGANAPICRAFQ